MKQFYYLQQDGNKRYLKYAASNVYAGMAVCIGFSIAILIRYWMGYINSGSLFFVAILVVLGFFMAMRLKHRIVFDPDNKTVTFPQLRNSEGRTLNFDQFLGFRVIKIKQYGLITVGTQLTMEFNINGKEKELLIKHYMLPSRKKMEELANEIEQVMDISHHEIMNG